MAAGLAQTVRANPRRLGVIYTDNLLVDLLVCVKAVEQGSPQVSHQSKSHLQILGAIKGDMKQVPLLRTHSAVVACDRQGYLALSARCEGTDTTFVGR